MPDKIEDLIKVIFRSWKADYGESCHDHPSEEFLASFIEGKLRGKDAQLIKDHLLGCQSCAEAVEVGLKLKNVDLNDIPPELRSWAKNLVSVQAGELLEIFLSLKGKIWEVLHTTGDILLGQELVPAPVLRSRHKENFKDEVTILKDFKGVRVEIKVENKVGKVFNLIVMAKDKKTQQAIKDLRFTLIRDALELESYSTDVGRVTFEHVLLGSYTVEISDMDGRLATILLDIKI